MHKHYQALFAEPDADRKLGGVDGLRADLDLAYRLGQEAASRGDLIDLDESEPFDIYTLFADVTAREYDGRQHLDELLILIIAASFERGAGVRDDPQPEL